MTSQLHLINTASSPQSNVLIVGGGPTGLAVALMLANRGWTNITVLEKRRANYSEPEKSFNYLIDGRGQKFTDLLGLTQVLSEVGVPNRKFSITRISPKGDRKTSTLSFGDSGRKTPYWLPRKVFVQLLYAEIERRWQDSITVVFDAQCTEINRIATEEGLQTLEVLAQIAQDEVKRFEPFFLIGCDGIQSIVRNTLNQWEPDRFEMKQFPSPSSGLKYKVLSLPPNFPLDAQHQDHAVSTMSYAVRGVQRERSRSFSLGLLPIRDQTAPRSANLINYADHPIWDLKTGEQVLQFLEQNVPQLPMREILSLDEAERFARSNGGVFPVPQFCPRLHFLLEQQTAEPIRAGVLLLGDAIHCFPPDIGQGVNAALEDVVVLNDSLCQSQDNLAQALPQYETARSPDVEAVTRLAQIAAPWQYNQNRLRSRLWAIQVFLRFGISRLLPGVSPPAFFLLQNHQLSYAEIWQQEQQGSQGFKVVSLILISGLLAFGLIFLITSLQRTSF